MAVAVLYRIESLYPLGHSMAVAVLRDTTKGTLRKCTVRDKNIHII